MAALGAIDEPEVPGVATHSAPEPVPEGVAKESVVRNSSPETSALMTPPPRI